MSWFWGKNSPSSAEETRQTEISTSSEQADSKGQGEKSGFWGLVDNIKEKGKEVAQVYREDLAFFAESLKSETEEVLKESIQGDDGHKGAIFEGISARFTDVVRRTTKGLEQIDKKFATEAQKRGLIKKTLDAEYDGQALEQLEESESTYLEDPQNNNYKAHAAIFELSEHNDRTTNILATNETVREIYSRLGMIFGQPGKVYFVSPMAVIPPRTLTHIVSVPISVSEKDFWCRYLYKVDELHRKAQKRDEMRKAAVLSSKKNPEVKDDDEELNWGDDEDAWPSEEGETAQLQHLTARTSECTMSDECITDKDDTSKSSTFEVADVVALEDVKAHSKVKSAQENPAGKTLNDVELEPSTASETKLIDDGKETTPANELTGLAGEASLVDGSVGERRMAVEGGESAESELKGGADSADPREGTATEETVASKGERTGQVEADDDWDEWE